MNDFVFMDKYDKLKAPYIGSFPMVNENGDDLIDLSLNFREGKIILKFKDGEDVSVLKKKKEILTNALKSILNPMDDLSEQLTKLSEDTKNMHGSSSINPSTVINIIDNPSYYKSIAYKALREVDKL